MPSPVIHELRCSRVFEWAIPRDFWHGPRRVGRHFAAGALGGYYEDLIHKTYTGREQLSREGVPLVKLGSGSYALHPVTVCQVALGWYERWLDHHYEADLSRFLVLADWLVRNQAMRDGIGGVWPVPYPVPTLGLRSQWVSALVQGQAISVLVRAAHATGREQYLVAAQYAVRPFSIETERGGVRRKQPRGGELYEEYPSSAGSGVLNGFISALWGLYDYVLLTGDPNAEEMFQAGLRWLVDSLPLYDTGYWSRYMLARPRGLSNLASPYYHAEHVIQLYATYALTEDESLRTRAQRWEQYSRSLVALLWVLLVKGTSRAARILQAGTRYP